MKNKISRSQKSKTIEINTTNLSQALGSNIVLKQLENSQNFAIMELLDVDKDILYDQVEKRTHGPSSSSVSSKKSLCDNRQSDPIQIAVKNDCPKVLQQLLSQKADVNRYKFSNSPLHIALSHGHMECAKLLIQHGAIIDFNQVLDLAVHQQEPKYVRFLTEKYKNEIMEHLKKTSAIKDILLTSVRKGNLEIIGLILDLGGDISGVNGSDMSPLAESKNGRVAKFLIDRGADAKHAKSMRQTDRGAEVKHLKCIRENSHTPLIEVLLNRDIIDNSVIEVINVLLEKGASANDRSWNGKTALMLAAVKEGSMSVMQLLLEHGAGINERDREGNTALMHAVFEGCVQNVSFLLRCITDKELLNLQNNEGLTALMYALRSRKRTTVKELVDQGGDVNIKDTDGNSHLLYEMVLSETLEGIVLRCLIQAGCDVNCQNNEGLSPLMMAAQNYSKNAMCLLLDSGAEINAVSKKDNTKTALAHLVYKQDLHNDYFRCVEYLLGRGANASYLPAGALHKMIMSGEILVVLKLIRCGFGPGAVSASDTFLYDQEDCKNLNRRSLIIKRFNCSPLITALISGNSDLARLFVANQYLTTYDVSLLGKNRPLRNHLEDEDDFECNDVLTELTTEPMTLFNLSFVAVSTAVGATPGREIRVNKLPVPQVIKEKLLFKKLDVTCLCY